VSASRYIISCVAILLILALAALCVVGAFLGSERAARLFDSPPLAIFWALFIALGLGAALSPPRLRNPGLLMMHLAPVLILAGAFIGSEKGHALARRYFHSEKVTAGVMVIPEGKAENAMFAFSTTKTVVRLPFELQLRRFTIEHYPETETGRTSGSFREPAPVRRYRSEVTILENGKPVAEKVIEVNHPLRYGGYSFFQNSYMTGRTPCTVLLVSSDSGLALVYAGFILLCAGAFWWAWVGPAWAATRKVYGH
jgi:hypothetical protein